MKEEHGVISRYCIFDHSTYLGGLSEEDDQLNGSLIFDQRGISLQRSGRDTEILQWRECTGLTIESQQVAKRKVAATLVFGTLGALAAKGSKVQSVITVRRRDGAFAYFVIDKMSALKLKAEIGPLLRIVGVPIVGDFPLDLTPPRNSGGDVISEIERLVALKKSGHIDEEEYTLLKRKLFE